MQFELIELKKIFQKCGDDPSKCEYKKSAKQDSQRREKIQIPAEDYIKIMDENFGSCPNPGNPYQKIKMNWYTALEICYVHYFRTRLINSDIQGSLL